MASTLEVLSAYDETVVGSVPYLDEAEAMAALDRAVAAFKERDGWLKPYERIEKLKKLATLVAAEAEDFAMLIAREGGKPLTDARVEVARAINGVGMGVEEIANLKGSEIAMGLTAASLNRKAFTTKEPIGVVVAVSAFNHPLNLIVHQVVPALATGCPIVIKPASATALCCQRFVELAYEAGFDRKWVQMAACANDIAEKLVTDPRVAFFSFIGSAKVGWYLRSKLAPGTRCALEHGGVAPVVIHDSADLDKAIPAMAKGGYYHAGQVCVSVQRIYVADSLYDRFMGRFKEEVAALSVGDPTLAETAVGPLIARREVDRVSAWVDEAKAAGADIVLGGSALSETVYNPTIIANPSDGLTVSKEEVFGPVTCVYRTGSLDEAIARANSLPVSFQAAIYAQDINAALRGGDRLDASAVMINDHTAFRVDWMPFAGHRVSGHGIGGIPYTMEDMVQDKMLVFNG